MDNKSHEAYGQQQGYPPQQGFPQQTQYGMQPPPAYTSQGAPPGPAVYPPAPGPALYPVVMEPPTPPFDENRAKTALERLRLLAMIGAPVGFANLVAGIVTIVYASENINYPVFNMAPLIIGLAMFIGYGILYWNINEAASRAATKESVIAVRKWAILGYVISIMTVVTTAACLRFSIETGVKCSYDDDICWPNIDENTIMAWVDMALGLVAIFVGALGLVFFCMYGRVFNIGRYRYGRGGRHCRTRNCD